MKLFSQAILTLMLLGAALMLAFGPRGAPAVEDGITVVTYWEKWTGEEGRQMQSVVDEFNRTVGREKRIHVNYLSISQVDRKALVSTAAGVPPDVVGLWQKDLAGFAARGALEPLDDLAAEHGITPALYKPVFWDMCTYDGRLYGLISTPAAVALHYNRHDFLAAAGAFRAAGLDPTRPPGSIAELDAAARALDRRDASGQIDRAGYLPMEPGWFITLTPYWFGGRLYDPSTGEFFFTTPETLAAFEWVQGYSRRLGKAALTDFSSQFGNFDSPNNAFLSGKVSMVKQGPWMANYIYRLRPAMSEALVPKSVELLLPRAAREFNYAWAVAPFPTGVADLKDVTFADADLLMIPRGARHRREAFEFMAFVQRQDVMERLNAMHCKPSPLAEVSEGFTRRHPNPYIATFDALARSPNAKIQVKSPLQSEIGAELEVAIQELYLLKKSVPEAMGDLQRRTTEKWADHQRREAARLQARGGDGGGGVPVAGGRREGAGR